MSTDYLGILKAGINKLRIFTSQDTSFEYTHRHRSQNAYEKTAHSRFLNSVSTSTQYDGVGRHIVAWSDPSIFLIVMLYV